MNMFYKTLIAAGFVAVAGTAQAASFDGYETTADVYFDGAADLFYDFGTGSIIDDGSGDLLLDVEFLDLGTGFEDGFASVVDLLTGSDTYFGTLIDYMFTDNMTGNDELALLFETDPGSGVTDFAVGTFTGELGSDFLDFGAAATGTFELVGASAATPIPLPAGLPLMLVGLGSLALLRRKTS